MIDNIQETTDPKYVKQKEEIKAVVQEGGMLCTAATVASVAFAVLGLTLIVATSFGGILGLPLISVSLPIGFFSYNGTKVLNNMLEILENPPLYKKGYGVSFNGISDSFDAKKLKAKLKQDTFQFDFFINYGVDKIIQKINKK